MSNPSTSVSVIIPFHSNVLWLKSAVESIQAQTFPVEEVIIICDGCGCDLSQIQASDARINVVTIDNRGPGGARNHAIDLAQGEYLAFLDADDIWYPHKVEHQLEMMISTGAEWSHTSYSKFRDSASAADVVAAVHSGKRHDGWTYPALLSSCSIATPTVMIRTATLRDDASLRFGGSMRFGEDLYLWARIAAKHRLLGIDLILTAVRIRGTNAALSPAVQLRARADLWQEIRSDPTGFRKSTIPLPIQFAYRACSRAYALYELLDPGAMGRRINYGIAVVLYLVPWCLFRLADRIESRRRKCS